MKKLALILAASWLATVASAKAGELDSEYGGKAKSVTSAPSLGKPSGELDAEAPTQAFFHGRRFFGHRRFGFGGFGLGFGYGYPGFGFGLYRGFYGYPGFGFGGFGRGFAYGGFGRFGRRW